MAKTKVKDTGSDFVGDAEGATDNLPAAEEAVAEEAVVEVVPDPKTQIVVNGGVVEAPEDWFRDKPRRLFIQGQNVEHVDDDEFGRWVYRSM